MERKVLQNTRIGVSEYDITSEKDRSVLLNWSAEIQKDIDDLRGKIDQAKDSKGEDSERLRIWQYVTRIQVLLKQRINHQLKLIAKEEGEKRKKRFEFAFINVAKRLLSDDVFQNIRTQALEEAAV